MVAPVNDVITHLNAIEDVEAEQLGGPYVRVGRSTVIRYTVGVEFDESDPSLQDKVQAVASSFPEVVDVQTDDSWGTDTWAFMVSNVGDTEF